MQRLRQRLLNPLDLTYDQTKALLTPEFYSGKITEKTDGMAFAVGWDEKGFYTQTANMERMRSENDYVKMEEYKSFTVGSKEWNKFSFLCSMSRIHTRFQENKALQDYLEFADKGCQFKGELFWLNFAECKDGKAQFNVMEYDVDKFGPNGSFVIHSYLPENVEHNEKSLLERFNRDGLNWDNDKIVYRGLYDDIEIPNDNFILGLSKEKEAFEKIDETLIKSRKYSEAREDEHQKLFNIKHAFELKLYNVVREITVSKWGGVPEGFVFHPDNPEQPRLKAFSELFLSRKKEIDYGRKC